jgi:hypothetical protein
MMTEKHIQYFSYSLFIDHANPSLNAIYYHIIKTRLSCYHDNVIMTMLSCYADNIPCYLMTGLSDCHDNVIMSS